MTDKDMPDGVRGAIAQARLALARAGAKPKPLRRDYVVESDAFTRSEIDQARGADHG